MIHAEMTLQNPAKQWNLKLLLLFHILAALLLTSLFSPVKIWEPIDVAFFKAINGTLRDRPFWQNFWAMANHRLADWLEDVCIFCFFFTYIKQAAKGLRLKRVAQLILLVLYVGAIILFVNDMIFRDAYNIPRSSPTRVVENSVRLSKEVTWLSVKDSSGKSFPGDHGTTALLFAASFAYLAGWRLGILASLYAAFLCMPRLITGAHWLSDVVVGSGSITIIFLSWMFCTPLFDKATALIERFFACVARLFRRQFLKRGHS